MTTSRGYGASGRLCEMSVVVVVCFLFLTNIIDGDGLFSKIPEGRPHTCFFKRNALHGQISEKNTVSLGTLRSLKMSSPRGARLVREW